MRILLRGTLAAALVAARLAVAAPLDDARLALDAREPARALALLEPLAAASPKDGAVLHELGRAYLQSDRLEPAISTLARALELQPEAAATHHLYGAALGRSLQSGGFFAAMRSAPKVKASFERAVALAPDQVEYRESLLLYYILAPAIAGGGEDKARREAAEIARRDERRGMLALARIELAEENEAAAVKTLETAIARWPEDGSLRVQVALLHHQAERWDEAFAALDEATRRDPAELGAWYQLGRTAVLSEQRLADGEAAFKRYLAGKPDVEDPPRAAAHWRLGMLYELMRRPADARTQYKAALALDPAHKDAKAALKKLK